MESRKTCIIRNIIFLGTEEITKEITLEQYNIKEIIDFMIEYKNKENELHRNSFCFKEENTQKCNEILDKNLITDLRKRNTELVEENRKLKKEIEEMKNHTTIPEFVKLKD